jgi:IclR family acetate operon transcriptional repressor
MGYVEIVPASAREARGERDDKSGLAERSFAVLDCVARANAPLAVPDIVAAVDLPRATVYRLVDWFEREGYLARDLARKRIVIGPRLAALAFNVLRASMHVAPRRAILQALAHTVGETCNIGTLDGGEIVYLDRVETETWPLRLQFSVGSHVPLHCTAIGKLFLAFLPPRQRRALLGALELRRFTDTTVTDPAALGRALDQIRKEAVSLDAQEFLSGVVCIAVPILGPRGEIRAAVAVQAPEARMSVADARRHLPALREAATRLAESFNAGP